MTRGKKIYGTLLLGLIVWIGFKYIERPNLDEIEEQTKEIESETSFRNNYQQLVSIDRTNGSSFMKSNYAHAKMFDNNFPFSSTHLSYQTASRIVSLLNDTTSYRWGEFGTPEYEKTIVFYDKQDEPIGYTLIDANGEVENYPYRSLMKWGMLTSDGFKSLMNELNREKSG